MQKIRMLLKSTFEEAVNHDPISKNQCDVCRCRSPFRRSHCQSRSWRNAIRAFMPASRLRSYENRRVLATCGLYPAFLLVNDSGSSLDVAANSCKIVVNGAELADSGWIFGNGPMPEVKAEA